MQRQYYDGERADLELAARAANQDPPRRVARYDDWEAVPPRRPTKPRPTVGEQVSGLFYGLTWIAVVVALVFVLALIGARQFLGVDLLRMIGDYRDFNAQLQATATAQARSTPLPTSPAGAGAAGATGDTQPTPPPLPTDVPAPAAPAAPPEQAVPTAVPPTPAPMAPPATDVPAAPTEAPTAAPMAPPPTALPPTPVPAPTATPEPELACINGHVHRLYWNGLDLEDEGTSCGTW